MDHFAPFAVGLGSPAGRHFSITPDDDADINPKPRYLYVAISGDLVIADSDGAEVTYAVTAGQHFRPTRAMETSAATVVGWI